MKCCFLVEYVKRYGDDYGRPDSGNDYVLKYQPSFVLLQGKAVQYLMFFLFIYTTFTGNTSHNYDYILVTSSAAIQLMHLVNVFFLNLFDRFLEICYSSVHSQDLYLSFNALG